MKKTVVLYPGLAVSHFVPMVQLADVLLEEGYAVVVAFIDPTLKGDIALAAVIDRAAASKPSVLFHMLPRAEDAPTFVHDSKFMVRYLEFVGRYSRHLHDFLFSMPPGSVHAVLVDMLSTEVLDVTSKLGIPAYAFFPSNASALAVSVQASSVRSEGQPSFGELGDAPLNLHGVPSMPASHLNAEMLEDPGRATFKATMNMFRRIQEANGILVNTFASIEPRAVLALSDPRSFPKMPPVYCIGPLVAGNGGQGTEKKHECLAWLDEQPEHSVVFLCFGSTGAGNHSEEQLNEIATGLERSGHRFLWVVRAPPHDCDVQTVQISERLQDIKERKEIATLANEMNPDEIQIPAKKPSNFTPPKEAATKTIDLLTGDPEKTAIISANLDLK